MRRDGKRLKGADAMYTVAAHIMAKRSDAMNMITLKKPNITNGEQEFLTMEKMKFRAFSFQALCSGLKNTTLTVLE